MNYIQKIVEEKIKEAMENGEFDNLPGNAIANRTGRGGEERDEV